jgi:hypothetical protein
MIALLPLVVLVAVVALVIVGVRRFRPDEGDGSERGHGGLRRFFVYALLFAAQVISAIGIAGLVRAVLPGEAVLAGRATFLARSLAFTVIGVPAYLLLCRHVRHLLRSPQEQRSLAWGTYLGLALSVSLAVSATAMADALRWLFGGDAAPEEAANALVWGGAWVWHWYLFSGKATAPQRMVTPSLLFGSLFGMVSTAVSVGVLVTGLADRAYDWLTATALGGGGRPDTLRTAGGFAVVGGLVWTWYWIRHARKLPRGALWHSYALVAGVTGGLVACLVSVGSIIYRGLEWWLGHPVANSAADHFRSIPDLIVVGLVGLVLFAYHRQLFADTPDFHASEPGRAERYLRSGVGLLATASGLGLVVRALLQSTTTPLIGAGSAVNTLMAGVALLVVATPVWLSVWLALQRASSTSVDEVASRSRRVYLILVLGASGVAALVTLIIIAFHLFQWLLEETRGTNLAEALSLPVGLLVATGAVAAYHWLVWREDRVRLPVRAPSIREVTILAANGELIADVVRRETGARVRVLQPIHEASSSSEPQDVLGAVTDLASPRILVVTDGEGKVRILGYHEQT